MAPTREFAATTYPDTLLENARRMASDTAPLTITAYQERWKTFINSQRDVQSLPNKLTSMVESVKQRAIDKKLSWSTVRLYKATICYGLTLTYLAKFSPTSPAYKTLRDTANFMPEKGLTFDNALTEDFFQDLYEDIKDFTLDAKDKSDADSSGKTSSTKAKNLPQEIYDIIINSPNYAGDNYELLRLFIEMNCILGLRPIEWFDVQGMSKRQFDATADVWFDKMSTADIEVITDKKRTLGRDQLQSGLFDIPENASVVLIKNGKNSLGRAGIEYRVLYSSDRDFYRKVNETKKAFMEVAGNLAEEKKAQGDTTFMDETGKANVVAFNRVMRMTQKKMRYILSNDKGIQSILVNKYNRMLARKRFTDDLTPEALEAFKKKTPMKVPTVYSTRHQAVANAKETGLSSVVIAAMFGHSSVVTAQRHYGKGSSGTGSSKVRPSEQNIDSVILGVTDVQMQMLQQNKFSKNSVKIARKDKVSSNIKTTEVAAIPTPGYDGFRP